MRATRMRLLPVTLPKLTKLERLDLGANSFIEFVSLNKINFLFQSSFHLA